MKLVYVHSGTRLKKPTVVCLGFFDGVHIGHAALVRRAVSAAQAKRLSVCVHTFDVMPSRVLHPETALSELTPLAEKAGLLEALGADIVAVSRFSETMDMRAPVFFEKILLRALHARHIVAGFHHHFGFRGEGNAALLASLCREAGIGIDIIEPVVLEDGELVSSTTIRSALAQGDLEKAERMLGRKPCRVRQDTEP